jgi:hypothetical protein
MPILIRERTEGKHELRVTHALLAKPFYKTFDDPDEAKRVGKRAIIELQKRHCSCMARTKETDRYHHHRRGNSRLRPNPRNTLQCRQSLRHLDQ